MKKLLQFLGVFLILFLTSSNVFAQYRFFDGNDWNLIKASGLNESDMEQVKVMLLKTIYETTIFDGTPMFAINSGKDDFLAVYNQDFARYPAIIDLFYSRPENAGFPVFYALRIADMLKNGIPETEVEQYKQAIVAKFREQGLIK